ncbi:hypothetical protein [Streptomyces sp. CBG33]|uniref:hypothetical protein n=1 Tax=Streptomyces sp. CBG33 TaxID=2762624 RepID=UPI0021BD627E|nr:hypothetical protein [Streptomyces sp. CBG33]
MRTIPGDVRTLGQLRGDWMRSADWTARVRTIHGSVRGPGELRNTGPLNTGRAAGVRASNGGIEALGRLRCVQPRGPNLSAMPRTVHRDVKTSPGLRNTRNTRKPSTNRPPGVPTVHERAGTPAELRNT